MGRGGFTGQSRAECGVRCGERWVHWSEQGRVWCEMWGEVGSLVRAGQSVVWDVGRGGFTGQSRAECGVGCGMLGSCL